MNRGRGLLATVAVTAGFLLGLLLAGFSTATAVAAEGGPVVWMKIEVNKDTAERPHVKVNIPLSMIEVFVESVDRRKFLDHLESGHADLDIANVWRQIREGDLDEFLTIETEEENVRVWKDADYFRVDVQAFESTGPDVRMTVPLAIMDYLFDPARSTLSFQEMVDTLRGYLPMTLLQADKEGESVRIWLEEE